jgi:hypothetical protein
MHVVGPGWVFNGNYDRPTFSPSILVTSGHYAGSGSKCWCTYNASEIAAGREPSGFKCSRCHSFVRNGQIQFLTDCTHKLAGKTVDLGLPPEVIAQLEESIKRADELVAELREARKIDPAILNRPMTI